MSDKTKKILLIIAFIIIVLILGFAIYYLFFRPFFAPTPPVTPITNQPGAGLPGGAPAINVPLVPTNVNAPLNIPTLPSGIPPTGIPGATISNTASGGLTSYQTLETASIKNPALATDGQNINYYDPSTGFFYTITPNGEKKLFSEESFKNVQNVVWAPNSQKAILEYPDGSNIIYDFKNKKSVTLPAQWKDFTFSDNSSQIAFKDMRLDPENRYISTSDTNGTNFQQIERIGDKDKSVYITWAPNEKYVALYSESIDADRADVYPVGFNGENFRKFTVEGRDLRFAWSTSGNKLLYSVYNAQSNYNPALWIVNSSPELLATGRTKLDLQTWASKCVFSSENEIYCAVPKTLDTGTGFRPDLADNTPDEFYKINTATGSKELLAQPVFPTTAEKLFISQDGQYLYWLEKTSGQIKKMNLK